MRRRRFVSSTLALAAAPMLARGETLIQTPKDYEGPFYPVGGRNRTNDLIVSAPNGDVLTLSGVVKRPDGSPRINALVDIWQTDPDGRYRHPRDRQGPRRDEFLYWGEAITDASGRFSFRTYVPGEYGFRPAAHIHYKVWADQRELLTSQFYFNELGGHRGHARNDKLAHLQVLNLRRMSEKTFSAEAQIVV